MGVQKRHHVLGQQLMLHVFCASGSRRRLLSHDCQEQRLHQCIRLRREAEVQVPRQIVAEAK
eukprot:7725455-Prorocentrum_lima.AAC.1